MSHTARTPKHALTHERILDVAGRTLRRVGYDGLRVAEVMQQAGLTHGGFYAHFPDRTGLLVEGLAHAMHQSGEAIDAAITRRRERGETAFRALVMSYLSMQHRNAVDTGCPVAALGAEAPRQPEPVQAAAREALAQMVARVRRNLPERVDAAQAPLVCAALVGALQLARGLEPDTRAREFLAQVRAALLQQYEPGH